MKLTLIAGARPNFIKIAPIVHVIQNKQSQGSDVVWRLVHTGQHYDKQMSETFFDELNIPKPDVNLGCGGGSQAEQTAAIMVAFEKELVEHPADLVIVVGDVTSTMACTIEAKKLGVKVAHGEAGNRSYDMEMAEEINRMVTDKLADYFFKNTTWACENLITVGIALEKIYWVGNVMIDTLMANRKRFRLPEFYSTIGLNEGKYFVLTLHRPANVDEVHHLKELMYEIIDNTQGYPIVFPIHPRTAKLFKEIGIEPPNLYVVDPLGYLEFNYLVERAFAVITDSGGITEETTVMGVPCMTLRNNTERPETCSMGTNKLIGTDPANIKPAMEQLYAGKWPKGIIPPMWDGKTSERIVNILLQL